MYQYLLATGIEAKRRYNAVPPDKKRRAWTIILIVVLILLFKSRIEFALRRMMHKDINRIDVNSQNLSYEPGEYYAMCSTLEASMNGTGTDEDSIYDVIMRLGTQDDWNYLQKCFGTRKKDGGTFFADLTGDLKAWLADDLDGGELQEVRDILRQSGITY
jgi:hypothetical protein